MAQKFKESGYEIVDMNDDISDICIVNTCTVTNMSDRKSRHSLRRVKEKNPSAIIAAVGCYAQVAKNDLENMPEIDIVLGNEEKANIVQYVEKFIENEKKLIEIEDIATKKEFEDMGQITYTEKTRAFIKVQDGCNQFCSYCIIPYARGRVRSRSLDDIMSEVKKLADSGCHEIVVTGIHLSSYGLDFDNKEYNSQPVPNAERLLQVLEAIAKVEGIDRIRLGSLEPRIITDEFLLRLSAIEQICPHFHLSLQSGCDETLRRMNRRYDTQEFYAGVVKIRKYFDKPAITTDVIVGFPGETDEEFEVTRKYLEKINFFEMHVFKYSRRKGTIADRMENQIPENIKSGRSDVLIELDERLSKEYRESFVNEYENVLVEEYIELEGKKYAVGHTKRYVRVLIELEDENSDNVHINDEVSVIIMGLLGKDSVISKVALAN